MVVQGGDLDPIGQRHTHDRIHLVLQQDHIPHHHRLGAHRLKRGPGGKTQGWGHLDTGHRHREIGAGDTDFEDTLLSVELAFGPRELLNLGRVERGIRRPDPAPPHHHNDEDPYCAREGDPWSRHTATSCRDGGWMGSVPPQ